MSNPALFNAPAAVLGGGSGTFGGLAAGKDALAATTLPVPCPRHDAKPPRALNDFADFLDGFNHIDLPGKPFFVPDSWWQWLVDKVTWYNDNIPKLADEWAKVFRGISDFLAKSVVDTAAVNARTAEYRRVQTMALSSCDQVAAQQRALSDAWKGRGGAAAIGVVAAWQGCLSATGSPLALMAGACTGAGAAFVDARLKALESLDKFGERVAQGRPHLSLGDFIILSKEDVKRLVAKYDEIKRYIQHVFDEAIHVLDKMMAAAEPGITKGNGQLGILHGVGQLFDRAKAAHQTGTDPGPMDQVHAGSYADSRRGTEHQDADAEGHYTASDMAPPPGFSPATEEELAALGITPDMLVNDNGFKAAVHVKRNPDGSIERIVVGFGGTDFGHSGDVLEDAIGSQTVSPQSANVLAITNALKSHPGTLDKTMFYGHSLGGRLAAVASIDTGCPAVTYNAAGVSNATTAFTAAANGKEYDDVNAATTTNIRAYRNPSDTLTNLQENTPGFESLPDAPGTNITVQDDPRLTTNPAQRLIDGHMMGNMREGWKKQYPK